MDPIMWLTQELLRLARIKARAIARGDRAAATILSARMSSLAAVIEAVQ